MTARLIAGELAGGKGPVAGVVTAPLYYDLSFTGRAEVSIPTPPGHNVFVYVFEGSVHVMGDNGGVVSRTEIALLDGGDQLVLRSDTDARCLVIGGQPLEEPVARYGPFVMNTQEEILQAISDYQSGTF